MNKYVAPERIRREILKALRYRKPSLFFEVLHDINIPVDILPGLEACFGQHGGPFHAEMVAEHAVI